MRDLVGRLDITTAEARRRARNRSRTATLPQTHPPPTQSSQELVHRAMGGSEAAFTELYRHVIGPTARYLRPKIGGRAGDVEELAHLAVATALQAVRDGKYDPLRARFTTFLFGIATKLRYRVAQATRAEVARWGRPFDSLGVEALQDLLPAQDDSPPLEQIEAALGCLQQGGSRHSLTAEERFVLIGTIHGARVQSQADQLNCGLATVHRRKQTALEKLRRCMAAKGYR